MRDLRLIAASCLGLGLVVGCATSGPSPAQLDYLSSLRAQAPQGAFCFSGLTWDEQYVVRYVTPRFERFGIAPGDRIVEVEGRSIAPADAGEWFADWELNGRPGDRVELDVERQGVTRSFAIDCGDGAPYVRAILEAVSTATIGEWSRCEQAVSGLETFGGASSYAARLRLSCRESYVRDVGDSGMPAWAQSYYEYGQRLLSENRRAGTLQDARAEILGLISELESSGYPRFARDLETQFEASGPIVAPQAPVEPTVAGGTCFAVGSEGMLMTAHHVIEGATETRVLWQGTWYDAEVVGSSRTVDAAVLRIAVRTVPFLPMVPAASVQPGARVFTFGYPVVDVLGDEAKFSDGSIASLSGLLGDQSLMQISVPIQPGNSGGPVVTEAGTAIGVIVSTAAVEAFFDTTGSLPQNVNWAVKTEAVSHLASLQVGESVTTREEAVNRASQAVCRVEAVR